MKKYLLLFLLLVSCSTPVQPQANLQLLPDVQKPTLNHVQFHIIKSGNQNFYSLDDNGVTILFNNLSALKAYIGKLKNQIIFYQDEVKDSIR